MQTSDLRYKNQGIHVIVSLLTIEDGKFKVLLAKRKNEPYKNFWCLLGGAVYNDETLDTAVKRELYEKSGIEGVEPIMFELFSDPLRAKETGFRMLGVGYLALIDQKAIKFIKETNKSSDVDWFDISKIPPLCYDHNQILNSSIKFLKSQIYKPEILKILYPDLVSIPELQNVFETVLQTKLDRRNFRKKLIQEEILVDTGTMKQTKGKKPCKLYKINVKK